MVVDPYGNIFGTNGLSELLRQPSIPLQNWIRVREATSLLGHLLSTATSIVFSDIWNGSAPEMHHPKMFHLFSSQTRLYSLEKPLKKPAPD